MGVIMPIYTVAILVFFIYTIVKILFKNKNNEEEEEDEEFLNSEYYKNCIAQNSSKKNTVTGGKTSSLTQQNCQDQKTIGDPTLKKCKPEEDSDRKQRQNQKEICKESKKTVSFDLEPDEKESNKEEISEDVEESPKIQCTEKRNTEKETKIKKCEIQKENAEVDPSKL